MVKAGSHPLDGGFRFTSSLEPPIISQGCALSHQISMLGLSQDVSSSVPALMNSISGMASSWEAIGEPQLPQNFRNTGRPLSPTSLKV
jgi:hypothetical protein